MGCKQSSRAGYSRHSAGAAQGPFSTGQLFYGVMQVGPVPTPSTLVPGRKYALRLKVSANGRPTNTSQVVYGLPLEDSRPPAPCPILPYALSRGKHGNSVLTMRMETLPWLKENTATPKKTEIREEILKDVRWPPPAKMLRARSSHIDPRQCLIYGTRHSLFESNYVTGNATNP